MSCPQAQGPSFEAHTRKHRTSWPVFGCRWCSIESRGNPSGNRNVKDKR